MHVYNSSNLLLTTCACFTAIVGLPIFRNILPEGISIKTNEGIILTWIIYGKNVPKYYDMTVKMDNKDLSRVTQRYSLNIYNCELIALADLEVNSGDLHVLGMHQFKLCAFFKSELLGTAENYCTNTTSVTIVQDCTIQGSYIDCMFVHEQS